MQQSLIGPKIPTIRKPTIEYLNIKFINLLTTTRNIVTSKLCDTGKSWQGSYRKAPRTPQLWHQQQSLARIRRITKIKPRPLSDTSISMPQDQKTHHTISSSNKHQICTRLRGSLLVANQSAWICKPVWVNASKLVHHHHHQHNLLQSCRTN